MPSRSRRDARHIATVDFVWVWEGDARPPDTVLRSPASIPAADDIMLSDRKWFEAHPAEDRYLRRYVPGEFLETPPPPPRGCELVTLVTVMGRDATGHSLFRYRELGIVQRRKCDA
jgi:hypothetical protein